MLWLVVLLQNPLSGVARFVKFTEFVWVFVDCLDIGALVLALKIWLISVPHIEFDLFEFRLIPMQKHVQVILCCILCDLQSAVVAFYGFVEFSYAGDRGESEDDVTLLQCQHVSDVDYARTPTAFHALQQQSRVGACDLTFPLFCTPQFVAHSGLQFIHQSLVFLHLVPFRHVKLGFVIFVFKIVCFKGRSLYQRIQFRIEVYLGVIRVSIYFEEVLNFQIIVATIFRYNIVHLFECFSNKEFLLSVV